MKRIWVLGASGAGKTTMVLELQRRLSLPRYELDRLVWQSGWRRVEEDDFRARTAGIVRSDAWIIDGQYEAVHEIVARAADTVIWLDPQMWLAYTRLVRRTARQLSSGAELWNGNRPTAARAVGLLIWAARSYAGVRRRNLALFQRLAARDTAPTRAVACTRIRTAADRTDLLNWIDVREANR